MNFKRDQSSLPEADVIRRQHYIPVEIYRFAVKQQLENTTVPGRGRQNVPTLTDIYFQLITEGLNLVEKKKAKPVFKEIGRPEGCRSCQIKFTKEPGSVNARIKIIKARADAGEFKVEPYKEISLISVAVTLMKVGIKKMDPDFYKQYF